MAEHAHGQRWPGYMRQLFSSNRLDDLVEVVFDLDGPVGEGGAVHAAAAEHVVELVPGRCVW